MLSHEHPLYVLADQIDWEEIDAELGSCYSETGRPAIATRMMVGLHYLKYAFNESDESIVWRWLENPYYQYLCGVKHFRSEFPIHPTSMGKWRKRMGSKKLESY